ncbi:YlbD family protein [Pseudalkalibacillus hwajinpoensis]|uniref:YlbD family protein n=1 Tax=Guptibacillus hwajinpoensis TaxID=208199 RepID=UPI001CFCB524|nr:YlbD family protein [Pseudalkalibacillus hwajinpoensis]
MPEAKEKGSQKVQEFKTFVKAHPHVLKKVKQNEKTLQELFEEWMLFGEDDPSWYEEEQKDDREVASEKGIGSMLGAIKQMNFEEVQKGIEQFSGAVYSIQEVLSQFRSKPKPPPYTQSRSPFPFRHD